ncbi:abortive infection Abi-like protein [Saccharopolyspora antimicrobica]|uniref:Abortive infection Abi-like protein n=1 Tax=Saccharopolyspora antimicrobica TaxID=455193 RepID=A0ABX9TH45_9PSEU|nr:abortive infection Abi-like protein [Saccharopolyspora antimicrobica]
MSKATIRALLDEFAASWTIRTIEDVFTDAGIVPVAPGEAPEEQGERRTTARQYLHSLDLSDPRDCLTLMPVFELVLEDMMNWDGTPAPQRVRLLERLRRDGFERQPDGTIRPTSAVVLPTLPSSQVDEAVLREHLTRLERGLEGDPAVVIGSSKELIESVCKLVLQRLTIEYDENDDVPALVKVTLKALKLHPETLAPTAPAGEAVKRILGSLASMAVGVAELRNKIGTGHGRGVTLKLSPRHAHLAAGAATTFARLLLETLEDPEAPWRAGQDSP